jgi:hypothetical protein
MRIAYKAFNKDLTCTMGKGIFQYEPGKWYEEPVANCVKNGFHCAANPLDCLNYYGDMDNSRYFRVAIDGDIDEDGTDTKISATKIKLIDELDIPTFLAHGIEYIRLHPNLRMNHRVKTETAKAERVEKFVIVRNGDPVAAASEVGQYIGLVRDGDPAPDAVALFYCDGDEFKPGVYYDVEGKERNA